MQRTHLASAAATALLLVGLAACGDTSDSGGAAGDGARTVEVDMVDIAFEPDRLEVKRGGHRQVRVRQPRGRGA